MDYEAMCNDALAKDTTSQRAYQELLPAKLPILIMAAKYQTAEYIAEWLSQYGIKATRYSVISLIKRFKSSIEPIRAKLETNQKPTEADILPPVVPVTNLNPQPSKPKKNRFNTDI